MIGGKFLTHKELSQNPVGYCSKGIDELSRLWYMVGINTKE